tara:strand:- start:22553 stop:22876 length:324 start_codon:yes stop_codon:yes gene_type:complete
MPSKEKCKKMVGKGKKYSNMKDCISYGKKKVDNPSSDSYKKEQGKKAAKSYGRMTGAAKGSAAYAIATKASGKKPNPVGLIASSAIGALYGQYKAVKKHKSNRKKNK